MNNYHSATISPPLLQIEPLVDEQLLIYLLAFIFCYLNLLKYLIGQNYVTAL